MEVIDGKVIVFTDQHFGIKGNSKSRLAIAVKVFDKIYEYAEKHGIKNIISCGDLFHNRNAIDVNTINAAYSCVEKLSKIAHVWLIVGNHDTYLKNSIDINSLVMFNDMKNVTIIAEETVCSINGNHSLFVPWLGNPNKWPNETFDMMFGHFDASHEYIIKAYVEDHSSAQCATSAVSAVLKEDKLLRASSNEKTAGDSIGDFIDAAKRNGIIFSGHIHQHREFIAKGRKFIMVGDPYQQNLGEINNTCGFYAINQDNTYEFVEITGIPKHVDISMSKALAGMDLSVAKGNIVHKVYDVDVSREDDARISQKITDWGPYEELLPDYEVRFEDTEMQLQNESIDLIRKSKLEYVRNYIHHIDAEVLTEQKIDKVKLYDILEEYYSKVTDEK